jgi:uridine kinase
MPVSFEEAVNRLRQGIHPALVGIDGLPVSGKSTLADRICEELGYESIALDDFVLPESDWPSRNRAAFPFEYVRYGEFLDAIRTVAATGSCRYRPYDWSTGSISPTEREVTLNRGVVVEGVSALHPDVASLYGLRVFVDSDAATTLEASLARGIGDWEGEWRDLFLPSTDLYMKTNPMGRADLVVAGRGVRPK